MSAFEPAPVERARRRISHVLYWDIDGTLLTTARAGVPALEDAAELVLGRRPDLSGMVTAGLTDRMIARLVISHVVGETDIATEDSFLAAYCDALPARLEQRRGSVLAGAREALEEFDARGDVANVLLTGNTRRGAMAKLTSYGLWQFFRTGGFAEDGRDRTDIAKSALRRAERLYGAAARSGVLIGDTPYDVRAGAAVGVRVLAIAGPTHSAEDLGRHSPWWVAEGIPSATEILARLHQGTTETS